jgi:phage terminase large subunit-like protein
VARKPTHPTTKYALDVNAGKIPACRWVRLACQRHIADLKKYGTRRSAGMWFDKKIAQAAIDFFPMFLRFYIGEFDGKPFVLEPWQQFIIGSIFGWKMGRFRRFRTAYLEIAKGNGKSPMAAGVGIYGLVADDEKGAEIYSAATMREQAGILFRDAKAFVESSPSLQRKLHVGVANIDYKANNSFFRPVSSEHRGLDGKRPHIALIDEIHEHPNATVIDKLGLGAKERRQALFFEITNAGYDRQSICFQHHEYTEKILEGIIANESWFGYMSGLDVCDKCRAEGKTIPQDGCADCDDWTDERVWPKANPNLGVSIQKSYIKEQVDKAANMPSMQNIVKRLNFCIWTQSVTRWIPFDVWNACATPVDPEALKGRICYGGLDLSSNTDVTAWVKVFPPEGEDILYRVICRFFLPEDNMMQRVKRDKVPYDVWAKQGFITLTPGNLIDYKFILAQIQQDMNDYQIAELAFDRWGSQKITTDLQELGFEIEGKRTLVQFGQGFASMSAPTKEVEKMVMGKELAHGGNPVLSWMVSNVAIKTDPAENKKPDKEKSKERIDGAVALIMAVGRAMLRGGQKKSVYDGLTAKEIQGRLAF